METTRQVILCGFGGQGIVLAGTVLARAAFYEGKWVAGVNSYGAAARGSICRTDVVISEKPIIFPRVLRADILVAMSQTAFNSYSRMAGDGALVLYDPDCVCPGQVPPGQRYVQIPATRSAVEGLNSGVVANIVMLGATAMVANLASDEALRRAVKETMRPEHLKLNLSALEIGFRLGRAAEPAISREMSYVTGRR